MHPPEKMMNMEKKFHYLCNKEYLTMKSLGTLTPQIMQNLGEQEVKGLFRDGF